MTVINVGLVCFRITVGGYTFPTDRKASVLTHQHLQQIIPTETIFSPYLLLSAFQTDGRINKSPVSPPCVTTSTVFRRRHLSFHALFTMRVQLSGRSMFSVELSNVLLNSTSRTYLQYTCLALVSVSASKSIRVSFSFVSLPTRGQYYLAALFFSLFTRSKVAATI